MISVIVPVFNEEEAIPYFYDVMEKVRKEMGDNLIYFCQ
ncbi:hypothetical protein SSU05_1006 [Streptococcus suis 05ZYH33]|nr:hypothetical protein SSU05_1006 [Streptococcus suis 05ZYH33]